MRKKLLRMAIFVIMPLTVFAQSQELCEGDAVTTNEHYNGVVKQVFPDGTAKVLLTDGRFSRYTYEYSTKNLSKPISCVGNICANDMVTTNEHYNGKVKQVFPDGTAKVLLTDGRFSRYTYEYSVEKLFLKQKCSQAGGTDCRQ